MKRKTMLSRTLGAAISSLLMISACAAPVSAVADTLTDLNGDGVINVFDLVLAKRETVEAANPMILDATDCSAMPGDTVTMQISLKNNPGFTSGSFMLHYDTACLEPLYAEDAISYTYDAALADVSAMVLPSSMHGTLVCMADASQAVAQDGNLFSIDFVVLENVPADAVYSVTVSDPMFYGAEGEQLTSLLLEKGSVAIPAHAANGTKNNRKPFSFGIDVSKWQGDIRWDEVVEDRKDIEFVMIRAGSGSGDPSFRSDPYFAQNYEGATAVGLPVGAYWYSYALTPEEAVAEAETCLAVLGDRALQFPIAYDVELKAQWEMSPEDFCAIIDAFCSTMEAAGCYVTVYSSASPLNTLYTEEMRQKYGVWVAQYAPDTVYNGDYGMWQYSCTGHVEGIDSDVDMNYCYYDYASIICNGGFNHCTPANE
ncbi:MAG: hypothetical protein IJC75_01240 [Oscillospiraceae bacterium]|nr:hypothetical protein [Oscillospiraceae bacterium]